MVAAAERDEHPRILLWVTLGLATGARQGELGRLRWSNVRVIDEGRVSEQHAIFTFYKTKNRDPKMVVLGKGKALEKLIEAMGRSSIPDKLILCTDKGAPTATHVTFPKGAWKRVRKQAGLDDSGVVFHTLRHTHASLLLQGGCSLAEIGQGLGHRSPVSTQRYVHLAEEHARKIADRLSSVVDW